MTRADYDRCRRFDRLWAAQGQQDIAAKMLPYLRDPERHLREHAARAMGRIENPAFQSALEQHLELQTSWEDESLQLLHDGRVEECQKINRKLHGMQIPALTLRLAIGRIQSRELRGKAKLEAVLKSARLNWDDLLYLSKQLDAKNYFFKHTSDAAQIQADIVSLMYVMRRRGENIQPLAIKLSLTPAQKVKLECAALPIKRELGVVLNYLASQPAVTVDATTLEDQVLLLKPYSIDALIDYLGKMKRAPAVYQKHYSSVSILDIAQKTGDPRLLAPLARFEPRQAKSKGGVRYVSRVRQLKVLLRYGFAPSPLAMDSSSRWTGWRSQDSRPVKVSRPSRPSLHSGRNDTHSAL